MVGTTRVVNAGSVGAPYGEPGAYWLLLGPDIRLQHTRFDLEHAARRIRETGYPGASEFAAGVLRPHAESEALEFFESNQAMTLFTPSDRLRVRDRVFLLPGCLQFDLSFTPAAEFGPRGPKFRLLFGATPDRSDAQPPPARELFGYAVHHALRARFCVERGRYWQAEYWISGVRDYALSLACSRRGLPAQHARGFDDLPADVLEAFREALPRSLDRHELLRALGCAIAGLLREADEAQDLAVRVEPALRTLTIPWGAGTR